MAHGYLGKSHQFTGNFSVLEGVMVKIGDKFQVPNKVTLPSDIRLVNSLNMSVEFDFSLEEKVIQKAIKERDQQVIDSLKATEILHQESTDDVQFEKTQANVNNMQGNAEDGKEGEKTAEFHITSMADAPILEPTQIYSKPVLENNSNKIPKQFNLSEFEDTNATPFELVELQTLDDINELKSVLQPETASNNKRQTISPNLKKPVEEEPDFSIFDFSSPKSNESNSKCEVATASLLDGIEPVDHNPNCNTTSDIFTAINRTSFVPLANQYNLPTDSEIRALSSSLSGQHYERYNSQKPALCTDYMTSDREVYKQSNKNSNLTNTNSKSLPNLADAGNPRVDQGTWSPPNDGQEPVVSTSRINSIMKQYQITRFSSNEKQESNTQEQPARSLDSDTSVAEIRSLPRHGLLSPLSKLPPLVPRTVTSTESSFTHQVKKDDVIANSERSIRQGNNSKDRQHKLSSSNILPPVQGPPSSSTQQTVSPSITRDSQLVHPPLSWLPDPTYSLSVEESQLLYRMVGMGFPLARTARAVQKFQDNEKKIIDFLVEIQQIADMGYDPDDVEVALQNNNNETDKVIGYLDLSNKWKELGFPQQKIHDALKNTDRQNETIFEYLTRQ